MASHQHKRPYAGSQPSITAYFPQAISPTSTCQQTCSITPSQAPAADRTQLPAHVQSNLLSVGMRVRKSVPEGYKTGAPYSAFTLFADSPPSRSSAQIPEVGGGSPIRNRPRARELTPFCGILKVGGMAQQQWGIYNTSSLARGSSGYDEREGEEDEEEEEDEDGLPALSQGSTMSSFSIASQGERKRRGEFDDEDAEERVEIARGRVNIMGFGERAMAVPRRKRTAAKELEIVGQENLNSDLDFGEANFLDYDLVGDSEMGGV